MALSTLSTYKVSLIGALILCDLGKQVCNYGMRYYSKTDEYPIPQCLLVAMLEIIKFTIVFVRTGGTVDQGFKVHNWWSFSSCLVYFISTPGLKEHEYLVQFLILSRVVHGKGYTVT